MKEYFKYFLIINVLFLAFFVLPVFALTGTINSINRYAWSENAGWIDFGATAGNVTITDSAMTGYAYGENIGWISFNCSNANSCSTVNYKVVTDDSIAPIVSSVSNSLGYLTNTQTIVITWVTDEISSTQLEYGLTTSYGETTTETDQNPRTNSHSVSIALSPCQLYHFRAISKDFLNNQGLSDDFTVQTACASPASAPVPVIVSSIESNLPTTDDQTSTNPIPAISVAPEIPEPEDQEQIKLMQK